MFASAYDRSRGIQRETVPFMAFPDTDPTDGVAHAASKVAEPERRLLLAVLSDAIVRVRQLATSRRQYGRRELVEAARWIRSDDRSWPYSFVNVCAALDLEPGPIRRTVVGWLHSSPTTPVTRRALLVGRLKPRRRRKSTAANAKAAAVAERSTAAETIGVGPDVAVRHAKRSGLGI